MRKLEIANTNMELCTYRALLYFWLDHLCFADLSHALFSFPQVYLFDLTYKQRPYTFLLPKKCHTSGGKCDAVTKGVNSRVEFCTTQLIFRVQEEDEAGCGCCWVVSAVQFIPWVPNSFCTGTKYEDRNDLWGGVCVWRVPKAVLKD